MGLQIFFKLLMLYCLSNACFGSAISLVDADAFKKGDHLAMYDSTSGLSWLDWGITNQEPGVANVLQDLMIDPKYNGWRLPTMMEVFHLIPQLLPDAGGDDVMGQTIVKTWGFNLAEIGDHRIRYDSLGYFNSANGWGYLRILYTPDYQYHDYSVNFVPFGDNDLPYWGYGRQIWSTLLVHDGLVFETPEPSISILFMVGLLGIFFSRLFLPRVSL